jgi:hypothetical protein
MIGWLRTLLRSTRRHAPAVPLEPEPRLHLIPGHYNRDRVAACLWHARRQPVAEHRSGTA